ncbi:Modulator of FtsH protease HflC [Roseibaca ekhonensis]|uniref:Protein HflC n=1 Tax=Roseinatronobacter ekhonensis TaxID=254356 RepID=A0A3B0MTH4_9RHOB|nr:protease modulator HflC [Roseibaca ekhonensis]SUZ32134.1 Modulator of FtsH protease HflC [Roseibaca ekhonensis]
MKKAGLILPVIAVAVVLAFSSLFIVDERENVLVLQFGQVKQEITEPGLGFKVPFIQEVVRYDARILGLQTQPLEVTPLDDRRLVVDAFLRWRLRDVSDFREAVGLDGVRGAQGRIESIMNASIREVLGSVPSNSVLSEDRTGLMNRIRDLARRQADSLGIEVVDVRLTRTDLPQENLEATFARMRAEREREAADERARGNEAAQRVRALADRTVTELVSSAQRDAEIVRGEADAERNRIYADAYNLDPEFFAFSRSMQSYAAALRGENSTMVLSPDSEFFNFLRTDGLSGESLAAAEAFARELEENPEAARERLPEPSAEEPESVRELEDMISN